MIQDLMDRWTASLRVAMESAAEKKGVGLTPQENFAIALAAGVDTEIVQEGHHLSLRTKQPVGVVWDGERYRVYASVGEYIVGDGRGLLSPTERDR